MKWQNLLLFLAGSSAALGSVVYLWPALIPVDRLAGLGLWLTSRLFTDWTGLSWPAGPLDPATWWAVCAVVVIDIVYLIWLRRHWRVRRFPSHDSDSLAQRHYLSADTYAEALRQRHDALLARYQDPGLVQFLLNREAARAQQLAQSIEVSDELCANAKITATTKPKQDEAEPHQRVEHPGLTMMVNPLGA